MSEQSKFRHLNADQVEEFEITEYQALGMCGEIIENTGPIERDLCQHLGLPKIGELRPEQLREALMYMTTVWPLGQLEAHLQTQYSQASTLVNDLHMAWLQVARQRALLTAQLLKLVTVLVIGALLMPPSFAFAPARSLPQQQPPSVATATSHPLDLTDLPSEARPIVFDTTAALEAELAARGISTFYDSEATRAELEPIERGNTDCLNGRTPDEAGKRLVAETVARITPGILALGGTFYPDVSAYFGPEFTQQCIMKFDNYTQALLAGYGSPAMLVQIDPNVLGGGVATMIFYKATGEAQFLFYSLAMQHITNNVMQLDHPAVERQSVINNALRLALLCFEYKLETTSRQVGNRNPCPFCDLCRLCLNNVVGDANKIYNGKKAGIEQATIAGSVAACVGVQTYLYRAGCLLAVLWGRKVALDIIAEEYNQGVRDKLEQCKKDIAELTKDLPGGVVRCEYRETPQ